MHGVVRQIFRINALDAWGYRLIVSRKTIAEVIVFQTGEATTWDRGSFGAFSRTTAIAANYAAVAFLDKVEVRERTARPIRPNLAGVSLAGIQ